MKKALSCAMPLFLVMLLAACSNPTNPTKPAVGLEPSVSLGGQAGSITAGTTGSATYAATTTNVANGTVGTIAWYADAAGNTPTGDPTGVTAGLSAVSGNAATVTMTVGVTSASGTYYFRLTEDGAASAVATLAVAPVPAGKVLATITTPDSTITVVYVRVLNGAGVQVGDGFLTKNGSSWQSLIDVSATGSLTFRAYLRNAYLTPLYFGTTTAFLAGLDDQVTINVAAHPSQSFSFDSNPGWSVAGDWVWGTPDGSVNPNDSCSESNASLGGCYGTDFSATGTHDLNSASMTFENDYLQMGPIDMTSYTGTSSLGLRFKMWFENDVGYDFGKMMVSTDGVTWNDLTAVSPAYDAASAGDSVLDSWTMVMNAWTDIRADLSAYGSATTLYVRWAYKTDDYVFTFGWYVDDVTVGRL